MSKKKPVKQRNTDPDRVKATIMMLESTRREVRSSLRQPILDAVEEYSQALDKLTDVETKLLIDLCHKHDMMPDSDPISNLMENSEEYKEAKQCVLRFMNRIQFYIASERFCTVPSLRAVIAEVARTEVRTNSMLQAEVTFRHEKTNLKSVVNNTTAKRKKKDKK